MSSTVVTIETLALGGAQDNINILPVCKQEMRLSSVHGCCVKPGMIYSNRDSQLTKSNLEMLSHPRPVKNQSFI